MFFFELKRFYNAVFFFSSRRRHTRSYGDWSSDVCSSDLRPTPRVASLGREMFHSGIWAHATYSILRPVPQSVDLNRATRLDIQVILEPKDRSINQGLRFIALVYLCIQIYVLYRRWTAPKSIHFYVFCLASFVLYGFRSTGELSWADWGNMVAQA